VRKQLLVEFLDMTKETTRYYSYRPEIDGLRALAVIAVIINHTIEELMPSGYLGVDIFFVLSGYVITSSLARREGKSLTYFISSFYARRVKRLVPALVLCVVVTSIFICLFDPTPGVSLKTGLTSLLGLSNIYLYTLSTNYFATSAELNVFLHTWSLGVEEQFYILFPFVIWFTGFSRQASNCTRNIFWVIVVVSAISLFGFIFLSDTNQAAAYFLSPTRFWELGAGCLTFLCLDNPNKFLHRLLENIRASWVLVALIAFLFIPAKFSVQTTIVVVFLTTVTIATLHPNTREYNLLTQKPVIYIGLISYSLYLWHWSVLSISNWTIGIHWWSIPIQFGLMLIFASGSYRFVERPLRKAEWSPARWKTIGYGLATSFGVAGLIFLATRYESSFEENIYLGSTHKDSQIVPLNHISNQSCMGVRVDDIPGDLSSRCTDQNKISSKKLFLVGDSHSEAYIQLFENLHEKFGWFVQTSHASGTSAPSIRFTGLGFQNLERAKKFTDIQDKVLKNVVALSSPGDLVVLLSRLADPFTTEKIDQKEKAATYRYYNEDLAQITLKESLDEFIEKLRSLSFELSEKEVDVIIFLPSPEFSFSNPLLCKKEWFRNDELSEKMCSISRNMLIKRIAPLNNSITALAQSVPNLYVYNPFDVICPPPLLAKSSSDCHMYRRDIPLFSDNDHISPDGSIFVYKDFTGFLRSNDLDGVQSNPTSSEDG